MIQFKNDQAVVFESSLFRTTSTVILTGDLLLVVDPNWLPAEVENIRRFVEFAKKERPVYLLFTHSDYDHIIGWLAFPGAKVIASQAFTQNPEKQKIVEQILAWDDEYYVTRNYPIEYPEADIEVIQDGQTFNEGNTRLTFYLAPGHNPDGIFTLVENNNLTSEGAIWLAGDYLSNVEFPYIYHSSKAYEETLAKVDEILKKHPVRLMVTGHGDAATNAKEILQRRDESLAYIRELRDSLLQGRDFDMKKLWQRYHFRRGMQKFHDENEQLMRREIG